MSVQSQPEPLVSARCQLSPAADKPSLMPRPAVMRPDRVMFDEPSLGIAPNLMQEVLGTIRELDRDGLTCLLVEQNVALSLKLASRAYVLENGSEAGLPRDVKSLYARSHRSR
jgi:ABC-type branched-subunit amino acid transport system ATPase component